MNRSWIPLLCLTCMTCTTPLLLGCAPEGQEARQSPPNIVLIIGDDHGYSDFGFMGSERVRTPTLDRLASEGTVFTHGFTTASTCRPSLQSLLTGLEPIQWSFVVSELARRGRIDRSRNPNEVVLTLPKLLAARGYATFVAGKLFDTTVEQAGFHDGIPMEGKGLFATSDLGRPSIDPVLEFLDRREEPFFLWFAPQLPHWPHDPPAEFVREYRNRGYSRRAEQYYGNVTRFDAVVGRLLAALEERDLLAETLVLYLADNGWLQDPDQGNAFALDGMKGKASIYEMGFRTPVLVHWPGHIPAGRVRDELVSSLDVLATILDYAGAPQPEWMSGRSLRGLATSQGEQHRDHLVGWIPTRRRFPDKASRDAAERGDARPAFWVRTADRRLVWREAPDTQELFAIETDPRETENLVAREPERASQLRRVAQDWRLEMMRDAQKALDAAQ